jgi:hypothetical protein
MRGILMDGMMGLTCKLRGGRKMEVKKDYLWFGYYTAEILKVHSEGNIADESLIKYLKEKLEEVKKETER